MKAYYMFSFSETYGYMFYGPALGAACIVHSMNIKIHTLYWL